MAVLFSHFADLPSRGAQEQSSLPLWEGGLGLRSARRSWADELKMAKERHPAVRAHAGFESPAWTELAEGHAPDPAEEEEAEASQLGDQRNFYDVTVWPQLMESDRAMMRSQGVPLARNPFFSFPVDRT